MRPIFAALAIALCSAQGGALAQPTGGEGPPLPPPLVESLPAPEPAAPSAGALPPDADGVVEKPPEPLRSCWGLIEFSYLWLKPARLPSPFGRQALPQPPSRLPLDFGASVLRYDTRPGFRLTLGDWLGPRSWLGVEGAFFYNGERSADLSAGGSVIAESPLLLLLLRGHEPPEGRDGRLLFAPDAWFGTQELFVASHILGAEANAVALLREGNHLRMDFLSGFRYLHLGESVDVRQAVTPLAGAPAFPGAFLSTDRLGVKNDFFGGQVGLRADVRTEHYFAELTGKVALGGVRDEIDLERSTFPPAPGIAPPVEARSSDGEFAWVPEITCRFGFRPDDHSCVYVGYSFLYLSGAARAADWVVPAFAPGAAPFPCERRPEFWAHGLLLGFERRY